MSDSSRERNECIEWLLWLLSLFKSKPKPRIFNPHANDSKCWNNECIWCKERP